MADATMHDVAVSALAKRHTERVAREAAATANRARMRAWSPEFADLCESLKAAGMFGRMIRLEIP